MTVLEKRAEELSLDSHVTLKQAAELTGTRYHALRMWLERSPNIPVKRIGSVYLLKRDDLQKYNHR